MALRLSVDTSYLIDFQRERVRGLQSGPAHRFLRQNRDAELFISVVAFGEFVEGFESSDDPNIQAVRLENNLLQVDAEIALAFGGIARRLRSQGQMIGANDLWIAATSLRHQLPLVTADIDHFQRIEGLEVIDYREAVGE